MREIGYSTLTPGRRLDDPLPSLIHLSTSASTVACGTHSYDLGTCTVDASRVTCPGCLATFTRTVSP